MSEDPAWVVRSRVSLDEVRTDADGFARVAVQRFLIEELIGEGAGEDDMKQILGTFLEDGSTNVLRRRSAVLAYERQDTAPEHPYDDDVIYEVRFHDIGHLFRQKLTERDS